MSGARACQLPDGTVQGNDASDSTCPAQRRDSWVRCHSRRQIRPTGVVLMHIDGFSHGLDEEARLTADEASQLAQYLPTAADRIEGNRSG